MDSASSSTCAREAAMKRSAAGIVVMLALTVLGVPRAEAETIAVFTKNQNSPIFAALRAGAAIAAKNLGVEVVQYMPSTADNVAEQNKLVDDAIKDKPDAIVFVPVDFTQAGGAVAKINAANIPLINVNERLSGGSVAGYVGTDDVALAATTARYLINAMSNKGDVVILDGPDDNLTAQGRARGFRDAVKDTPDVKLLAGKSGNYARAQGKQVTSDFLRSYPQIDGILAANDPMAIGAVDALKAAGRKSLVVGINASREVMDLIKSGDIAGSGDYDTFAQGCVGVELAVNAIRKQPVPHEVMLKPVVIDKTNDAPFDQPYEKRQCPTLASVMAQ
jgi:ribose transport system substrate-binding protein